VKRDSAYNPLTERYAAREIAYLFSTDLKFRTLRRLWVALAEAEQELGRPITDQQIAELRAHANDINYDEALGWAGLRLVREPAWSIQALPSATPEQVVVREGWVTGRKGRLGVRRAG